MTIPHVCTQTHEQDQEELSMGTLQQHVQVLHGLQDSHHVGVGLWVYGCGLVD
jgi:hypothetical protein